MKRPFVSVIVTAYNRREFIRDAIRSVINSMLPEGEYELIVVKNFRDEYVDNIVGKIGGKSIFTNLISIGAKVALGIDAAEGDVITFLEDDDMYLPDRLEIIRKVFDNDPSLNYYHNNIITINEIGRPIRDELVEMTNIYNVIIAHNSRDKLNVVKKYGWALGLRISSMAVKRVFIDKWVNVIRRFPDVVDPLIFTLALIDTGTILHDPRRLTYYRVSSTSASSVRMISNPVSRFNKAVNNAVRHALARHMLVTLAEELGLGRYIKYDEATIIGGVYGNWGKWLSRVVIDLVGCQSMTCIGSIMFGLMYLVSPWFAKRLIYLYYTRVFDVLWGLRF